MSPYDWQEHLLLVCFGIRGVGNFGCLLEHCSQEEFFEWVEATYGEGSREVNGMDITRLTEDTFDLLRPRYERLGRVLTGE